MTFIFVDRVDSRGLSKFRKEKVNKVALIFISQKALKKPTFKKAVWGGCKANRQRTTGVEQLKKKKKSVTKRISDV